MTTFKTNDLPAPSLVPYDRDALFLKRLTECVDANISNENFHPEHLMDLLHVSRSLLYKKVKRVTGTSVGMFVRQARLKRSVLLLAQDHLTVSQVAHAVGFSDPAYFGKCFREMYRVPPSKFAKQSDAVAC